MSAPLYSYPRLAAFVLSEAEGQRSRENVVVAQTGTEIRSGTVLTKSATIGSAGTFAMNPAATGRPTSGAITVGTAATPGTYVGTFTSATAFTLKAPSGATVGSGTLGTAFNSGGLQFTLTAGTPAAVAGDTFTINVTPSAARYIPYTANGAAGDANAILYSHLPAATGDVDAVAFVRDCEVNRKELLGLDNKAEGTLNAVGVIVRGSTGLMEIHTPAL